MPFQRTIMLGVVGDSAAGKTTITRDIARILGEDQVTVICTDDYHRYNRKQRKEMGITALHPDCNYIDIIEQHLDLLRRGHPILKPIYNHSTGDFDPPEYIEPKSYIIAEGLLGFHSKTMRRPFDIKVFLAPEDDLRVQWKIKRDTAKRGYTEEQVLSALQGRINDSRDFIQTQQKFGDIVVSYKMPPDHLAGDSSHLDVELKLRPTLSHPDLSELIQLGEEKHMIRSTVSREDGRLVEVLDIDGRLTTEEAGQMEALFWKNLPELKALALDDLGQYLNGTEKKQSYTLALTQLLIVYHMVQMRRELDIEIEKLVRK